MTAPHPHADHDRQLVAAHASGDLTGRQHDEAAQLLAACPDCAALHDDLLVLAQAIHELPPPRRTRDFRLSPEDVAGLRRGPWRRFLAGLAGPRFAVAGPLGATIATLGLAGLLLAAIPGVSLVGVASAPVRPTASDDHSAAIGYTPADTPAALGTAGAPGGETERDDSASPQPLALPGVGTFRTEGSTGSGGGTGSAGGGTGSGSDRNVAHASDASAAQRDAHSALAILSGSFLILGGALLGIRWTARRLG